MNIRRFLLVPTAAASLLLAAAPALHAAPTDYQYTGFITAMSDATFTVQKGKENSEFVKDAGATLPAGAKVGDKVTVHYIMHAVSVEGRDLREKHPPKDKAKAAAAPLITPAAAVPATVQPAPAVPVAH